MGLNVTIGVELSAIIESVPELLVRGTVGFVAIGLTTTVAVGVNPCPDEGTGSLSASRGNASSDARSLRISEVGAEDGGGGFNEIGGLEFTHEFDGKTDEIAPILVDAIGFTPEPPTDCSVPENAQLEAGAVSKDEPTAPGFVSKLGNNPAFG